ncbi:MAG TPA: type II toxin-antitoxin system ParD family antitoxin [Pirellulaceae bacterium]|nr:type II toxin-antitoxin system ParD family antitoxin [Pirellulaceae bacterium]
MSYSFPPDVQQLIDVQLASGRFASEDDVLREALRALQPFEDETAAIQAAIDDWQNGDEGLPIDEAFNNIRESIREGKSP